MPKGNHKTSVLKHTLGLTEDERKVLRAAVNDRIAYLFHHLYSSQEQATLQALLRRLDT